MSLQEKIYRIVELDDDDRSLAALIFEWLIIFLILLNVVTIILSTFEGFSASTLLAFNYVEGISVAIFTVEYALRFWTAPCMYPNMRPAKARLKYVFSFMAIIDLLAILPFYITLISPSMNPFDLRILRMLRLFRLLRILKMNRYASGLATIGIVLKKKAAQLASAMFVVLVFMVIVSVLMFDIESQAQPDMFTNVFTGMLWAVSTLTSVGYGDIYPVTPLGEFLGAVIGFLGIGLIAIPTGIISAGFIEELTAQEKDEQQLCSNCGNKL